jgi:hypothetical protein
MGIFGHFSATMEVSAAEPPREQDAAARPRPQLNTQVSTLWQRKQNAVCVRRACKRYGTVGNPAVVLENLNMTVPKGSM